MGNKLLTTLIFTALATSASQPDDADIDSWISDEQRDQIENYQPSVDTTATLKRTLEQRYSLTKEDKQALHTFKSLINSKEMIEAQKKWRLQLATKMGVNAWQTKEQQTNSAQQGRVSNSSPLPFSEKPLLFISQSIPLSTLRRYAADLEAVGGVMIMRGFVGGLSEMKPTLRFIDSIIKKRAHCTTEPCERYRTQVLVDPILFREYQIQRVPAFTIHGATILSSYCHDTEELNTATAVAYGDTSIKHLATTVFRHTSNPAHKQIAEALR
jgi:conjugal transfer pilus assembly protein TrbC